MTNHIATADEVGKVRARRAALMAERNKAIANRDWAAMNETTKRIAKLPSLKAVGGGRIELVYGLEN